MRDFAATAPKELIAALRKERVRILEQLHTDPLFQHLRKIEGLLAVYEARNSSVEAAADATAETQVTRHTPKERPPKKPSFKRTETGMYQVQRAGEEYLRRKGSRASSSEIAQHLVEQGLIKPHPRQAATVSSYLSRDKEVFDNVAKPGQGYGLKEWSRPGPKAETPDSGQLSGAPTSEGRLPLEQ